MKHKYFLSFITIILIALATYGGYTLYKINKAQDTVTTEIHSTGQKIREEVSGASGATKRDYERGKKKIGEVAKNKYENWKNKKDNY